MISRTDDRKCRNVPRGGVFWLNLACIFTFVVCYLKDNLTGLCVLPTSVGRARVRCTLRLWSSGSLDTDIDTDSLER